MQSKRAEMPRMEQGKHGPDATPEPGDGAGKPANGGGFKFNQVGREETTTQVLAPRVDAATRRRTVQMIALAVVALALLILVSIVRLGVDRKDGGAPPAAEFGPQDRPIDPGAR